MSSSSKRKEEEKPLKNAAPYGIDSNTKIQLFLECTKNAQEMDKKRSIVPINSLITLFVLKFADDQKQAWPNLVEINFAPVNNTNLKENKNWTFELKEDLTNFGKVLPSVELVPRQVRNCLLPCVFIEEKRVAITGLCSVIRFLLRWRQIVKGDRKDTHPLLGYQGGCLSSPAEVSNWTRFCEISLPRAIVSSNSHDVFREEGGTQERLLSIPKEIESFESHLRKPVKLHNIRKRMQEEEKKKKKKSSQKLIEQGKEIEIDFHPIKPPSAAHYSFPSDSSFDSDSCNRTNEEMKIRIEEGKELTFDPVTGKDRDPIEIYARNQHIFAEGPDLLLSDVIIYINLFVWLESFPEDLKIEILTSKLPRIRNWLIKMNARNSNRLANDLVAISPRNPICDLKVKKVGLGGDEVGFDGDKVGFDGDKVGLGSEKVGLGSEKVGLGSEKVGLGGDEVGFDSDKVVLGGDEVGLGSDEVGLEGDKVGLEGDEVGLEGDEVGIGSEEVGLSYDLSEESAPRKFYTKQSDIDRIFEWVDKKKEEEENSASKLFEHSFGNLKITSTTNEEKEERSKFLDWEKLPLLVHPKGGDLPAKRLEKKCQQLENMAEAIVDIVNSDKRKKNSKVRIVDFCSGGGHLGILVASILTESEIYLIENKEESLKRAQERIEKLGLTNCYMYQCNLDYFVGSFDVGTSLHACGVATDLVMKTCIEKEASFVCCPCCYGSVQENHVLKYPRSDKFRRLGWSFKDYSIVGHTADQTHVTNSKHQQGLKAMDLIDVDRGLYAQEQGDYRVNLTKMRPVSCTPKNNLLIGKKL